MIRQIDGKKEVVQNQADKRFYEAFYASLSIASIATAEDGKLCNVNDKWVDTFGYSPTEAIGKTPAELGIWVEPTKENLLLDRFQKGPGRKRRSDPAHPRRSGNPSATLRHTYRNRRTATAYRRCRRYHGSASGRTTTAGERTNQSGDFCGGRRKHHFDRCGGDRPRSERSRCRASRQDCGRVPRPMHL